VAASIRGLVAGVLTLGVAGVIAGCAGTASSPPPSLRSSSAATGALSSAALSSAALSSGALSSGAASSAAGLSETNPAGDIPDNQAFVDFNPLNGGYAVKIPEGWARTDSATGTVFTDKFNTITIQAAPAASAPTVASVQAVEVPQIQATVQGFQPGSVTTADRAAGTAVLITYQADSPPSPVTGKVAALAVERYEFWKSGTGVTVTLSAPVGSDNVDPWRTVTDSFRWMP